MHDNGLVKAPTNCAQRLNGSSRKLHRPKSVRTRHLYSPLFLLVLFLPTLLFLSVFCSSCLLLPLLLVFSFLSLRLSSLPVQALSYRPPPLRQCPFGFLDLDETRSEGFWLSYGRGERGCPRSRKRISG